jgi:hypothetical protein
MKNVTLAVDDKLLEASREYAQRHHTTLNAMVRDLLERTVRPEAENAGLKEFLRLASQAKGDSKGWKWNREELYDV